MQPPAPRGRGSHLEPANRFTLRTVERDLDGLDADDLAALARRPTRYVVDHAVGIVSENDSPDVPFRFSLNPYRGCLHGCAYCLVGETPILMADGTTRPLADLRVGEAIYGTVLKGRYRYFTRTPVLAHWQTVKPAYRIRLADGTELVASPDHRFLTQRGWKYVAPAEVGQRPYLTLNDWLLGIGGFTSDSARTADDQPGYLTDLRIVSIDSLGIQLPMYDITTGTGDFIANGIVSHNCYARPSHEYLGLNAGLDFETIIFVKERAPALFRDWLARPAWVPEPITLSGVTDPYQPAERDYRLTRGCLEVALEALQPVSLITKNALLTRDLDLLAPLASQNLVHATVSVTTLDDELARSMEPRASTPAARLRAVRELAGAGVPVRVLVAPIIPGLNDAEVPALLAAAKEAGAAAAGFVLLRLPGAVEAVFREWLARLRPSWRERVEGRIRATRGGKLNDPRFGRRMSGEGEMAEQIGHLFKLFARRLSLDGPLPDYDTSRFRPPRPSSGQGWLF